MIALLIPDISDATFSENAKGVEEAAKEFNYNVIFYNTGYSFTKEKEAIETLRAHQVDGLIITTNYPDSDYLEHLNNSGYPFVLLRRRSLNNSISYVDVDNFYGGYIAVKHLIKLNHEKIGFVLLPNDSTTVRERMKGALHALSEHKLALNNEFVFQKDKSEESGIMAIKKLMSRKDRPTALFALNDRIAFGAYLETLRMGIDVPNELSIIGFDDLFYSSLPHIEMTTISIPRFEMGMEAMKILAHKLTNPKDKTSSMIFKPQLVVRKTCKEINYK